MRHDGSQDKEQVKGSNSFAFELSHQYPEEEVKGDQKRSPGDEK